MRDVSIDIETYSSADIRTCGAYKYAQSPDFAILLIAYAVGDGPVCVIDMTVLDDSAPTAHTLLDALEGGDADERRCHVRAQLETFKALLADDEAVLHAYNASFEWYCLMRAGFPTRLESWRCTRIQGMYCGYPGSLEAAGEALGLDVDKRKLATGRSLIRLFCQPQADGGSVWPCDQPEKWRLFMEYNARDVEAEREIARRLAPWPVPDDEWRLWQIDQRINARGVKVDAALIDGALAIDERETQALLDEARILTGLSNPRSVQQLTGWLTQELGEPPQDLSKGTVSLLLDKGVCTASAERLLQIRQLLGKTSTRKYRAMRAAMCEDGRVRGLLQFYGAARTGRWAGKLVQVQNLPRNYITDLDLARRLAREGDGEALKLFYGNVPDTLSQLIRTAFVPEAGAYFLVSDFSAIEARVIAWLAGESWRMEVFRTHGKIYEASAASMFRVPIETIAKGQPNYALRAKGKVAELALGYQGGPGALIAMGALKMGLNEADLPDIVQRWRRANPAICGLWRDVDNAARDALRGAGRAQTHGIVFECTGDARYTFLTVRLPGGRKLYYPQPHIVRDALGGERMAFMGAQQGKRGWTELTTYGGKLVENIVQATARDCLATTLTRMTAAGYEPVFHVHDEVIVEYPCADRSQAEAALAQLYAIMAMPPDWAPDLPLRGDGDVLDYYRKT